MHWRLRPTRDLLIAGALFALVWATHSLSRNATLFDSRWTVLTALSILHQGNTNLDEYLPRLERDRFCLIECVWPDGRAVRATSAAQCRGAHFYSWHPAAVPMLATPAVGILEATLRAAQPVLRPVWSRMPDGPRRSFLEGDLAASSSIVEVLIASLLVAAAAVVMYFIAREYLARAPAAAIALVFGFATPAWSIASRGLWQHGPCMLMLSIALLLAVRAERRPALIRLAGIALVLAFFLRPTGAIPLTVFSVFVLLRHRRHLAPYLAWAAPLALLFLAYNFSVYHAWLAPYFHVRRPGWHGLSLHADFFEALAGNWISPGRGLLVYCPVFALSICGALLRPRSTYAASLRCVAVVVIAAHWVLISLVEGWWGGHCFGPRLFSDITPFFVFLLIPVLSRGHAWRAAFVLLAALSVAIHYRGANDWACYQWNVDPVNVDFYPARVWDWRDPPFLRGLGAARSQTGSPVR